MMAYGFLEKELERVAVETMLRLENIRGRLKPLVAAGDKKAAQLDTFLAALTASVEGKARLYHRIKIGELTQKLGIGDSNFSASVRVKELLEGLSLAELVMDCRVQTARKVLADTEISVATTSDLVGFNLVRTFHDNFVRLVGETPQEYSRRTRAGRPPIFRLSCEAMIRRAGNGELTLEEQFLLRDTLAERFPAVFGVPQPVEVPQPIDAEEWERFQAQTRLWPRLVEMSFDEQLCVVRGWPVATPALFRFLITKSRETGRKNKLQGVEGSKVALASLESSRLLLSEVAIYPLKAEGLAWLGNAHRLNMEFLEADTEIRKAVAMVEARDVGAGVTGVVFFLYATLRMFQRRHDKAEELFERSLRSIDQTDDATWKARILRQAASAAIYAGKSDEALDYLRRAKALATTAEDLFSADYHGIVALERAGCYEQAALALDQLRSVEPPSMRWRLELEWVGGSIAEGLGHLEAAEAKYRNLLRSFTALDEPFDTALISLDLATLCVDMVKLDEAHQLSAVVYQFFSSARVCDETLRSLEALGHATRRGTITRVILQDLRGTLRRDPWLELRQAQEKAQGPQSRIP
jgi:AraC-like DNA-binding protein/tetratricopeptide (TPR) repeat protein